MPTVIREGQYKGFTHVTGLELCGELTIGGVTYPAVPNTGMAVVVPLNPARTFNQGLGSFIESKTRRIFGDDIADRVNIQRSEDFDLSIEPKRIQYALARIHPYVTGVGSVKKLDAFLVEEKITSEINHEVASAELIVEINRMSEERLRDLYEEAFKQVNTSSLSPSVIKQKLIEEARHNPVAPGGLDALNPGLRDILNDKDYPKKVLFNKLLGSGHIKYLGGYYRLENPVTGDEEPLGPTRKDCYMYFGANPTIMGQLMIFAKIESRYAVKDKEKLKKAVKESDSGKEE